MPNLLSRLFRRKRKPRPLSNRYTSDTANDVLLPGSSYPVLPTFADHSPIRHTQHCGDAGSSNYDGGGDSGCSDGGGGDGGGGDGGGGSD